jgi:hypothetical protein
MGAAAYARGSAAISRQIEADARPAEFALMDELNALPKRDGAPVPFGEIRFAASHGGWWAVCPVTGFGFWHRSLREAVRSYRVEVYAHDSGEWIARPAAEPLD